MMPLLKSKYRKEPEVKQFPAVAIPVVVEQAPVQPRTLAVVYIPKSVAKLWTQYARPPRVWNRIYTHKAVVNSLYPEVVFSLDEWVKFPLAMFKVPESEIDRGYDKKVAPVVPESPKAFDEPISPPPRDFIEWQRTNPAFSFLGLNSIKQ